MKRINGGLGILLSFAVGAGVTGGVLNYEFRSSAPETQYVRTVSDTETVSPTPTATDTATYDMTPPGVESTPSQTVAEGDDGSLGGPVLNETNQAEPTYIVNTPTEAPTSENANDDDTEVTEPQVDRSATGTPEPRETRPEPPAVTVTPSADDHAQETPSGDTPTG